MGKFLFYCLDLYLKFSQIFDNEYIFLKQKHIILGWPKSSFGFFCNILQKNPNELFGQPKINKQWKILET